MKVPTELRYLPSHEWCRVNGDTATIGISDFAQDQLGEIVYLELPALGDTLTQQTTFGTIESVKAAEDLNSPVSGEVIAVNTAVEAALEPINTDPYGAGWLVQVKLADTTELDSLLDAAAYQAHCDAGH